MSRNTLPPADHRPWPPPDRPWCMTQTWEDLCFMHWPIEPRELRPLLPRSVELDTFDGAAWLGIVPFNLSHIRVRGLPTLPLLSHFPEINVRTYVRHEDKSGVWFLSLDANHVILSAVARRWFRLPYRHSNVTIRCRDSWIDYTCSHRRLGFAPIELRASCRPSGPIDYAGGGSLAHWLTERYCLFTANRRGDVYRAEILHSPWPLQPAVVRIECNTLALASGIRFPDARPIAHYSESITSLIWSPELVDVEAQATSGIAHVPSN